MVPVSFQSIRDESIVGINTHIACLGKLCFVVGSLYLLLAQPVGFSQARLQFLLNRQRYLESRGID